MGATQGGPVIHIGWTWEGEAPAEPGLNVGLAFDFSARLPNPVCGSAGASPSQVQRLI